MRRERKFLIHLLLPFLFSFVMVDIFIQVGNKKLTEEALEYSELFGGKVLTNVRNIIYSACSAGESFLSTMVYSKGEVDATTGRNVYVHYISYPDQQMLSYEETYNMLDQFLDANQTYYTAGLIIDPEKASFGSDSGFIAITQSGTHRHFNKENKETVFNSDIFKRGSRARYPFFVEHKRSGDDTTGTITYVVPLFTEKSDTPAGQFWLDIKLESISETINEKLAYNWASIGLFDENLNLIACNYPEYNGMDINDSRLDFSKEDKEDIKNLSNQNRNSVSEIDLYGSHYFRYTYYLEDFDFMLIVLIPEEEMFETRDSFILTLHIVAISGALLMLIFSYMVFRIYVKEIKKRTQIENDIAIAAQIQQTILPNNRSSGSFYSLRASNIPARIIGGDLFNYIMKNNRLYFCVGDVSGKGVPASLFMGMTSSNLSNALNISDDPGRILGLVNDSLSNKNEECMFCTMFVGMIEKGTSVLQFSNAGHNPPIIIRSNGSVSFLPVESSTPLGTFSGIEYQTDSIKFREGDKLFIYSDGVTEARSTKGAVFGTDALVELLESMKSSDSPDEIINNVLSSLGEFTSKAAQSDDITMLCVQAEKNPLIS